MPKSRHLVFAALAAFFLAGFGAMRAHAQQDGADFSAISALRPIVTTYDVYVGGIHFLTADILFREKDRRYETYVHARTYGYLYRWLKWDGNILSEGRIEGDRFIPVQYRNLDIWQKKAKEVELDFDGRGGVKTSFEPAGNGKGSDLVSAGQRRDTLDPVTALLQMLGHVAVDGDCTMRVPVFDGKRRFDLDGTDQGTEYINEGDYGIYSGPAHRCDVDFSLISGQWKDSEKNRFWEHAKGQTSRGAFRIWLAHPARDLPELPVRLESTSAWGDIVAHLTKWRYASSGDLKTQFPQSVPQFVKAAD